MNIYQIIKSILTVVGVISMFLMYAFVFYWLVMFFSRNKNLEKRKKVATGAVICLITSAASMVLHFAVSMNQYTRPFSFDNLPRFTVESTDLTGDRWDASIGMDSANRSPQLSWEAPSDKLLYEIVMLDETDQNRVCWITETEDLKLDGGAAAENVSDDDPSVKKSLYSGPKNSSEAVVYVFALKTPCKNISAFTGETCDFDQLVEELNDSSYTDYDNLYAVGILRGNYSLNN